MRQPAPAGGIRPQVLLHRGFLAAGEEHRPDLLDRDAELGPVHDRIGQVPAVEAHEVDGREAGEPDRRRRVGRDVQRRARVVLVMGAQAPRAPDVVLEPGAADRGELGVAVAVHLQLALAVPHALVEHAHADVAADEPTGPGEAVGDDEVAPQHGRVLATERGVQEAARVGARGLERVVDLVVEQHRRGRRVRDLDAHVLRERHREIRVEPSPFLRRRERRRVPHRAPVWHAEEVEARHRHARLGGAVVEHLHPQRAHRLGRGGRKRHPEVAQRSRPVEIGEHDRLAGRDRRARPTLAAVVGLAAGAARTGRVLEGDRPAVECRVDVRWAEEHARCSTPPTFDGARSQRTIRDPE